MSVRLKLTLSYVGFLMIAGTLLLTAVWVFLLRGRSNSLYVPGRSDFLRVFDPSSNFGPAVFVPAAILVLAFLLVFGLAGGWILAGRMLAPLTRITDATRTATMGSLSHRIELEGRQDEFRELENTGDKLSPHVVSTLTEPFQRGTERIRSDHVGVGLGLAIAKSITQAHDGTLSLSPRADGGLCVTVRLPATARQLS